MCGLFLIGGFFFLKKTKKKNGPSQGGVGFMQHNWNIDGTETLVTDVFRFILAI